MIASAVPPATPSTVVKVDEFVCADEPTYVDVVALYHLHAQALMLLGTKYGIPPRSLYVLLALNVNTPVDVFAVMSELNDDSTFVNITFDAAAVIACVVVLLTLI